MTTAGSVSGSPRRFTAAWARDAGERIVATAIVVGGGAVIGQYAADLATDPNPTPWRAGAIAALQVIKVLLGGLVGRPSSASLLPDVAGPVDTTPVP